MVITDVKNGEKIEAQIESLTTEDYKQIRKDKRFNFDWDTEKYSEVFKLTLDNQILGLISLKTVLEQLYIEINLLEISRENVGREKKYENIAGCLIAYACRLSFKRGCDGFVCLIPKTELKDHYNRQYGMKFMGLKNYTDSENSKKLIERYLED
ncbi:MAG: hypothetical protein IAF38_22200 [Bacteroidia bacterium]|nr:hypothetical protein [Bacteroidia bacterium]